MSTKRLNFAASAALSQEMADLVDDVAKSTVLVNARKRLPVSGLLIKPNQVLTVDHGVEKEEGIEIVFTGSGSITGNLVGRDPGSDLALIRLDQDISEFQSIDPAPARVGMPILMVARPEPEGHQASFGIVTSIGSGLRTMKGSVLDHYIATDATPYPGFSGGPLAALGGGVLGINTSGLVGGLSLAIPLNLALGMASQLASFGRVKRGFLGIRSQKVELSEALRKADPAAFKSGLLILGLENDGPAAVSGLLMGDILVTAGERPLADHDDLIVLLAGDVAGKELQFKVVRGGVFMDVQVKVGER